MTGGAPSRNSSDWCKEHTLEQGKDLKRAWGSERAREKQNAGSFAGIQDGKKADKLDRQQGYTAEGLCAGLSTLGVMDLGVCI